MHKIRKNSPMNTTGTELYYLGKDKIYKPKFDHALALTKYSGWAAACIQINSTFVSSQNIKLYINTNNKTVYKDVLTRIKNGGELQKGDILYDTYPVQPYQKRFLAGNEENKPAGIVYRSLKSWGQDFEEIVDSHPLLTLINYELLYSIVVNLELTGNAYLYIIVDDNDEPTRLQILSPALIHPKINKEGQVISYEYGNLKDKKTITKENIIHFKYPSNNSLEGVGPLQMAWRTINLDEAVTEQRQSLFDNDLTMSMLVAFKQGSSKDTKARFEQGVMSQLLGPGNAGKMLMVDGEIEVTPISLNPKDIGNQEEGLLRKYSAIFSVPLARLLGTNINRSSAESMDRGWLRGKISLILNLISSKLTEGLIPFYSDTQELVLAFDNPVPADKQFEATKNLQYLAAGVYPLNYVKAIEGLPPVEGGDESKPTAVPTEEPVEDNTEENDTIEELRQEIERLKEDINNPEKE